MGGFGEYLGREGGVVRQISGTERGFRLMVCVFSANVEDEKGGTPAYLRERKGVSVNGVESDVFGECL